MKNNKGSELYLSREQVNAIMYILDCYLKINNPQNRYVQFAKKMKNKITEYGRVFNDKGNEMISLYMYEKNYAELTMLFSTFVSSTYSIREDYYDHLCNQTKTKKSISKNFPEEKSNEKNDSYDKDLYFSESELEELL